MLKRVENVWNNWNNSRKILGKDERKRYYTLIHNIFLFIWCCFIKKERDQRLANLTKLRTFNADLHAGLEEFRENDPDILSRMEDASAVAKAATDRWTDNIDTVTSWLKTKSGLGDE